MFCLVTSFLFGTNANFIELSPFSPEAASPAGMPGVNKLLKCLVALGESPALSHP